MENCANLEEEITGSIWEVASFRCFVQLLLCPFSTLSIVKEAKSAKKVQGSCEKDSVNGERKFRLLNSHKLDPV